MERYENVELIVRKIVPTLTGDADKDEDSFYAMANKYANHPRYGVICARLAKEYAGLVASRIASGSTAIGTAVRPRPREEFPPKISPGRQLHLLLFAGDGSRPDEV